MTSEEKNLLIKKFSASPEGMKALKLLKESDTCDGDLAVLKKVAGDAGVERVVPYILKADPSWSLQVLRFIPHLGKYQQPLIDRAALLYKDMVLPTVEALVTPLKKISAFELYLKGNAAFAGSFTMYWFTPPLSSPNNWQPVKGTPNSGSWVYSSKLDVYQSATVDCKKFALKNSPLAAGDTVVMILNIAGHVGGLINTGFLYTYDPNVQSKAKIETWGGVDGVDYSASVIAIKPKS